MFLLANSCARKGVASGVDALRRGVPLLDVLEIVLRESETDLTERSVGLGGWPNVLGQVELDASLMDGRTRLSGSVGALQGYLHPVSVAREVMRRLPHVFLVGEGAALFASEVGAETAELLTAEAEAEWREWLEANVPAVLDDSGPDGNSFDPGRDLSGMPPALLERIPLAELVWRSAHRIAQKDTAIALVSDGKEIASGTTTCGWGFKYPGRLGDSAVVGAGHYADSAAGAAACTHTGEMTIRAGTSRLAVLRLQQGATAGDACAEAIADVKRLSEGFLAGVTVYAVDARGNHCATSTGVLGEYFWWTPELGRPEARVSTVI